MNEPTVEDLQRLRTAARGNPAADAAYVEAWNRADQATKEALMRHVPGVRDAGVLRADRQEARPVSDEPSAAELGQAYEAIEDRSDYAAIEKYAELWDKASTMTKARAMFGLYKEK